MTWYWPYAVRSSNNCASCFADMPSSTWKRLPQKEKWTKKWFIPMETPYCCWPFWRPVVGGDTCSSLAPTLRPQLKDRLYHHLAMFMAVSMMPNTCHPSRYCKRRSFGADIVWGVLLEPACMWPKLLQQKIRRRVSVWILNSRCGGRAIQISKIIVTVQGITAQWWKLS